MNKWILLLAALLLAASAGYAQSVLGRVVLATAAPRQYEKMEWDIAVGEQFAQPSTGSQ
jgi:hypothetical protein